MALYLEIEWKHRGTGRIPALNREAVDLPDGHIESIKPVEEVVTSRDSLDERRYRGTDISRVIPNLREGDRVAVSTYPDSYGDVELTITKHQCEDVIGDSKTGTGYHLISRFWGSQQQGNGNPWLRTVASYASQGEIEELEVLELTEDDT